VKANKLHFVAGGYVFLVYAYSLITLAKLLTYCDLSPWQNVMTK